MHDPIHWLNACLLRCYSLNNTQIHSNHALFYYCNAMKLNRVAIINLFACTCKNLMCLVHIIKNILDEVDKISATAQQLKILSKRMDKKDYCSSKSI